MKTRKSLNTPEKSRLSLQLCRVRARKILALLKRAIPSPRCELYYHTPYQLLISTVLSAQATDKVVNRCMQPLYDKGLTPETLLDLGIEGILEHIRPIGLAPTKAKNIWHLTKILIEKFCAEVPRERVDLEALPGVGRKTASVVLGELFNEPVLAVDTHVLRVTRRLGLHHEKTPDKAEAILLQILPRSSLPEAHHLFVLHGRYTCKAASRLCQSCPLNAICPSAVIN